MPTKEEPQKAEETGEAQRCEDGQVNDVAPAPQGPEEAAADEAAPAPGDGDPADGTGAPGRQQPPAPAAIEAIHTAYTRTIRHPAKLAMPDSRDGLTTEERIAFPVLLHRIVSDSDTDDCIHWLACGTRFMASLKLRSQRVLPFLRTNNWPETNTHTALRQEEVHCQGAAEVHFYFLFSAAVPCFSSLPSLFFQVLRPR